MSMREPFVPVAWPGTYVTNYSDWREGNIVHLHRTCDAVGYVIQTSQPAGLDPPALAVSAVLLNVRDMRSGAMCNIPSWGCAYATAESRFACSVCRCFP